jgi:hypothetical protein
MWPMPGYDAKAEGPKSYVLERYDGEVAWEATIDWRTTSDYYGSDEIWDEAGLVVVSHGGEVCGLDLGSGAMLHQFSAGAQLRYAGVQREKGQLVLVSDEAVWCLDEAFQVLWHTDLGANSVSFKHIDGDRLLLDVRYQDLDSWERVLVDAQSGNVRMRTPWRTPARVHDFPTELERHFESLLARIRGSRLAVVHYWHPQGHLVSNSELDTGLLLVELRTQENNSLFIGPGRETYDSDIALSEGFPPVTWLDHPHEMVEVAAHPRWCELMGDVIIDARLHWSWTALSVPMEYPEHTPPELFPPEAKDKMWGDRPYTHSARSYYLLDIELTFVSGRRVYLCRGQIDEQGVFWVDEGHLTVLFDEATAERLKLGSFETDDSPVS